MSDSATYKQCRGTGTPATGDQARCTCGQDVPVKDGRIALHFEPRQSSVAHHPAVAHVLQYFACDHLPPHLQEVVRPYAALADEVAGRSSNPETTVALRKLLESKDAAVRAAIPEK